ncbi:MAG: sigma-70 family RNA polymerase sigma factor [Clostridia bacterium]|nr:sigma-70 family RNA polymerase sigma factor [Clostridia bacterium]
MKETVDFSKLINEAKNGSGAAFEKLYNLTIKTSYRTASLLLKNPDDIEDVLQNSYLKVHNRLSELKNPESFESWVKTIVENESKNYIKKEKSISAPLIFFKNKNEEYSEEWKKPVPQEYMEKNELRENVSKIVDGLSPEVRACIVLFHFEDKTLNEISEILDVPVGTVKSRLYNGRKQIEKEFNKLRKKDPSLYGIAAIPAVLAFLTYKSANLAVPVALSESVLTAATATGAAAVTSSVAAGSAVTGATVAGGASTAATATASIAVKVTAIAVAGTLTVGGSVAIKNYVDEKKEMP